MLLAKVRRIAAEEAERVFADRRADVVAEVLAELRKTAQGETFPQSGRKTSGKDQV